VYTRAVVIISDLVLDTTLTLQGLGATPNVLTILLLFALLVTKELMAVLSTSEGKFLNRALTIVVVPLVFVFMAQVVERFMEG
jgi:hypothetical protein